jgi:hypothetical protein
MFLISQFIRNKKLKAMFNAKIGQTKLIYTLKIAIVALLGRSLFAQLKRVKGNRVLLRK